MKGTPCRAAHLSGCDPVYNTNIHKDARERTDQSRCTSDSPQNLTELFADGPTDFPARPSGGQRQR